MFEKEKQLVINVGEWCSSQGKVSMTQIRKECQNAGLVFDEMLILIGSINCFKIIPPTNSQFCIKVGYKNCWKQTIEKFFEEKVHKAYLAQMEEMYLNLSIDEKKRNKWLSIIAICISLVSLIIAIVGLCLTF